MLETGVIVFIGMALLLAKLPRQLMLRMLAFPLLLDLTVSILVLLIHWGTFSGVMAATVAGLLTSILTSGLRYLIGYRTASAYVPGVINLDALE